MYKGASQGLQRAYRVDKPLPTGGYIDAPSDDDFIATADNLSLDECRSENRQLQIELTKAEAELAAAKAIRDTKAIAAIGQRIQVLVQRKSPYKRRINELTQQSREHRLWEAVRTVCSDAQIEQIKAMCAPID